MIANHCRADDVIAQRGVWEKHDKDGHLWTMNDVDVENPSYVHREMKCSCGETFLVNCYER